MNVNVQSETNDEGSSYKNMRLIFMHVEYVASEKTTENLLRYSSVA